MLRLIFRQSRSPTKLKVGKSFSASPHPDQIHGNEELYREVESVGETLLGKKLLKTDSKEGSVGSQRRVDGTSERLYFLQTSILE